MKWPLLASLLVASTLVGCSGNGLQGKFQHCILSNASAATNKAQTKLVRNTCARKYEETMPNSARRRIDGNLGKMVFGLSYGIELRNKTSNWTVTEVEYSVQIGNDEEISHYRHDIFIRPLQKATFRISLETEPKKNQKVNWWIDKAWGIPVKN